MIGLCLLAAAFAGDDPGSAAASDWGLHLAGGLGGGTPVPGAQVHGVGRFELRLGTVGISLAGREGVATGDTRTIGAIFAGGRWDVSDRHWVRAGFAHSHETPWAQFTAAPVGAFLGVSSGITHRSGLEAGAALRTAEADGLLGGRLGLAVDGWATWFPDTLGPPVTVGLDLLGTIRVQ